MQQATSDNFFFANDAEQAEGIYTAVLPDGSSIKQLTLLDCKKTAQVRVAKSRDYIEVARITRNKDSQVRALIAICTTIEGNRLTPSEVDRLSYRDFMKLAYAFDKLTFK